MGRNWAGTYCRKPDMTDNGYSTSVHAHFHRRDISGQGDNAVGDDDSVVVAPNSGSAACSAYSHRDIVDDGDASHVCLHDSRNIEHFRPVPVHHG